MTKYRYKSDIYGLDIKGKWLQGSGSGIQAAKSRFKIDGRERKLKDEIGPWAIHIYSSNWFKWFETLKS